MRDRFHWPPLLAFVTGLVNQELLLRKEYLAAENRILRAPPSPKAPVVGSETIQAPHHSQLVSAPGCVEVRRIPAAWLSRPTSGLTRSYIGSSFPRISQRLSFGDPQGVPQPVLIAFAHLSLEETIAKNTRASLNARSPVIVVLPFAVRYPRLG